MPRTPPTPLPRSRSTLRLGLLLTLVGVGVVSATAGAIWLTAGIFERKVVRTAVTPTPLASHSAPFSAVRDLVIDDIEVLAIYGGRLYGVEDHFLYVSDDFGETFHQRGVLPKADSGLFVRLHDRLARHPLVRAARTSSRPDNLVVLSSGTILVFYDRIYRSEDDGWTFEVLDTPVDALHSPTKSAIAVDSRDRVVFGEYAVGERPLTIRVAMGTSDGREWRVCHTFAPGQVFHVHSVSYDLYADRFLVATGDRNEESGLWALDPECGGVELVGGGDQRWRLLAPIFAQTFILWGSDDDTDGADIWMKRRGGTHLVHAHHLGKPAYFSTALTDGTYVVTTAFEPDSRFTLDHDPDPSAEVWVSRDGEHWHPLDRFVWAEREHWWGRSRAMARPPTGDVSSPYLFLAPVETEDGFVTYRYRIDWHEDSNGD